LFICKFLLHARWGCSHTWISHVEHAASWSVCQPHATPKHCCMTSCSSTDSTYNPCRDIEMVGSTVCNRWHKISLLFEPLAYSQYWFYWWATPCTRQQPQDR
jgi:hypothetical protein